ncbi:5'-methylthioadenosine/S-adenosylhomocysteine nucleosidase [Desemzia sp. RIT804]|uniref:5'-methylthioadenosine/S-adenosylhomocysteine nucleosidase n=1 Tax=Desemzia sp. RIT 804 TaxID=2810209 RepID=UPI0019519714|nr:5'-methylthioadenosine/S-adenosylhomocysteine nucleosidase [Desemzia sp. RIT 804]
MQKQTVIAIQGAMDGEIAVLLEAMQTYTEEKHGSYSFFLGEVEKIPLVVSRTEIGMVNAAAATALLIDKYQPSVIINQGTAGGHDPQLNVFDTIIGKEIVHINNFVSNHLEEGEGMSPESWVPMQTFVREENNKLKDVFVFESDSELVKVALELGPEYTNGKVVEGRIGTADFWNREIDRINWLHEKFQTRGEEMEAYAVAQIARAFNTPFLSIRTISNSEITQEYIEDLDTAGKYCAEFSLLVAKTIYQQNLVLQTR